jgi:hypothetical protein
LTVLPSFFEQLMAWLSSATPAWLVVCLLVACLALFWQQRALIRRLDNHAESIAHMDEWADDVEEAINTLEEKAKRMAPTYLPVRSQAVDVRRWWQK